MKYSLLDKLSLIMLRTKRFDSWTVGPLRPDSSITSQVLYDID